ncbi:MAG TPA: adenylate/guanylate cyclase domain-containing protein [Planctomycetaceae bacterium]|nr:adenylate/guanylate cyclase domain-containing protein [Planctomycetaceae bacterium]
MIDGALLFADISGFTALSERLARHGKEGSEELTILLNEYFEAMVDVVSGRGGDILQFGGDSLLAAFGTVEANADGAESLAGDRPSGGPPSSVLDAVRTGLDMQSTMSRFERLETSAGRFDLQMSIAVHWGRFLLASAGAWAGHVQQVAMGGALNRLAAGQAIALPGEVVVTREASRLLGDRVQAGAPRDGCVPILRLTGRPVEPGAAGSEAGRRDCQTPDFLRLDAAMRPEELLRPYLIPAVYRRVVDDPVGCGNEGEHRFITTMFVHFADTAAVMARFGDAATADVVRYLDSYLAAMSRAVERHGGALARVSGDARGDRLLVLFGAPLAIENPEDHALRCALEMHRRLEEFNATAPVPLEQRIGITSGSAFCGNVGSHRRREYTVIADQVNTAARLMAAAATSETLVSRSVWQKARKSFHFEPRGPLRLKGKEHAVDVYRLVAARERRAGRRRPKRMLIGREAECERFRTILDDVRDGPGQLVTIAGDAGVGKSRLLEEFVAQCRDAGMAVFRSECMPFGQASPYHAWAAIVRDLALIDRHDAAAVAQAKLVARLVRTSPDLAVWSPLLGDVLGSPWPDSDRTAAASPRQRKAKLFAICLDLLAGQAREHPTVFVLEDIHWIDPLSHELLVELSRRVAESRLLIVATHRPEFELSEHSAGVPVNRLDLGPLSSDSTAEMLGVLLGTSAAPDRLTDLVVAKSQGNPFFIEEIVHALVASGHVVRDPAGRRCEFAPDPGVVDLPGTIQGLVLSRVDGLPEEHRRILQVASVFGRSFPRAALRSVLPFRVSTPALDSRLDEICRQELIVREPSAAAPGGSETCTFRHALIHEAVYESLSYARRREIHRAIGEELEQTCGGAIEERCDVLARHFDLARVPDKAFSYLSLAGDRARRACANVEAADYYQRALACGEALGERAAAPAVVPLLENLGDVLSLNGDYAAARDRYQQAARQSHSAVDRARLEGKIGGVCYRQGQPRSGIEHLEAGLAHLGIRMPRTRWQVRASLVRQLLIQTAHTLLPQALFRNRSGTAEASRAAIEIYEALSRISFEADLEKTLDAHLRQLNLCETLPGSPEMAQTYSSHGIVCGTIPLFGRALRYQRKGLAIREARGDRWGVAQSSNFMGICYYWMGRWDQARRCLEDSARIFEDVGDRWESEVTYLLLSYIALRRGELGEAARQARTSMDLSRRANDSQGMGWALGALAEACCRQGRLDQALAHARQALACSQQARDRMYLAVLRRILGAIYLKSGDAERAVVELRGSVQQVRGERLRHEYVVGAYAGLAEASLACLPAEPTPADPSRARSLVRIRRLCRTAVGRARKFRNWLPEAYRVSALCEWAAGRPRSAGQFFERSMVVSEALGARYESALSWYDAGRFLLAGGRVEARECLVRARELFDQCGALLDRDRAEALVWGMPGRTGNGRREVRGPHLPWGRWGTNGSFPGVVLRRNSS